MDEDLELYSFGIVFSASLEIKVPDILDRYIILLIQLVDILLVEYLVLQKTHSNHKVQEVTVIVKQFAFIVCLLRESLANYGVLYDIRHAVQISINSYSFQCVFLATVLAYDVAVLAHHSTEHVRIGPFVQHVVDTCDVQVFDAKFGQLGES